MFEHEFTVRFGDVDQAGVVYFPRYFDFFHRTFETFLEDAGVSFREMMMKDRVGFPAVHAEADYRSPLFLGDRCTLALSVVKVGRASVTFQYDGRVGPRPAVSGRVVVAAVHLDTGKAMGVPEPFVSLFRRHLTHGDPSVA